MTDMERARPGQGNGLSPNDIAADDKAKGTEHPSQLALDAADPWVRASWRTAVETDAAAGYLFSADDTQVRYGLADLGNGTGGIFMAAAKAGRIEKAGYRPSRKAGRNGGIVAVWRGVTGR